MFYKIIKKIGNAAIENTLLHPYLTVGAIALVAIAPSFCLRDYITSFIDKTAHRFDDANMLRTQFTHANMTPVKEYKNHSHGTAAAARATAKNFIDHTASMVGYETYMVQMSATDQGKGYAGWKSYFWAKDVQAHPQTKKPTLNMIHTLIDVDYYIDMNKYLLDHTAPTALYTVIPEAVAAVEKDWSFTFDDKNNLLQHVTSGVEHRHPLWNYGLDIVQVNSTNFWDYILLRPTSVVYQVEIRRVAPHRCVVLLIPTASWRGPAGYVAGILLGKQLSQLKVVQGDFTRLDIISNFNDSCHMRSTGKPNAYHCATIPVDTDTSIASAALTSSVKLTLAQIASYLGEANEPTDKTKKRTMVALAEYHTKNFSLKPEAVYPVERSVHNYQFSPDHYEPTATHSVTPFMHPIALGAYAPDKTLENEKMAVKARVTDVASNAESTPFMSRCMDEFLELMIPVPHQMEPVQPEEVYANQNKPSQRSILDQAAHAWWMPRIIKSFMKAESYNEPKEPRIISQINGCDKLEYSSFLYTLAEFMKKLPWYAFGKTPKEIAEKIADICGNAKSHIDTSDLSRQDGRISPAMREFERKLLLRGFNKAHARKIVELHSAQYNLRATTSKGVKYETKYSRASGSSETSNFNTAVTAFLCYYALRLDTETSKGLSAQDAWDALGFYGGDDAVNADMDPVRLARAARAVGQVIKSNVIHRGSAGVNFLARYYSPLVWEGAPDSCCDFKRQMIKFHTTVNITGYTPAQKLVEKCRAYYLTDSNTPFIGAYCAKVLHLADVKPEDIDPTKLNKQIVPYYSHFSFADQFANDNVENWMDDLIHDQLPDFPMSEAIKWVDSITTIGQALAAPLMSIAKPIADVPAPVVIDGEIIHPVKQLDLTIKKIVHRDLKPNDKKSKPIRSALRPTAFRTSKKKRVVLVEALKQQKTNKTVSGTK